MTGNVKDNKRIACYGDSLAVIEKGKIIKRIIIDEDVIKDKIDTVIKKRETKLEPYNIFRKSVEDITGYTYYGCRTTPIIEGVRESIHDQKIYKIWSTYILNTETMKRLHKEYLESLKIKKEISRKNGIILSSNNPNFKPYMLHAHKR